MMTMWVTNGLLMALWVTKARHDGNIGREQYEGGCKWCVISSVSIHESFSSMGPFQCQSFSLVIMVVYILFVISHSECNHELHQIQVVALNVIFNFVL